MSSFNSVVLWVSLCKPFIAALQQFFNKILKFFYKSYLLEQKTKRRDLLVLVLVLVLVHVLLGKVNGFFWEKVIKLCIKKFI